MESRPEAAKAWDTWLARFLTEMGFVQAWVSDFEYDYWQNTVGGKKARAYRYEASICALEVYGSQWTNIDPSILEPPSRGRWHDANWIMLADMTFTRRLLAVGALVGAVAVVVAMTVHAPRERSTSVEVESPRANASGAVQPPTERTSRLPAERATTPSEQQRAAGEPPTQATPSPPAAPVSGRHIAQQIDWAALRRGSPIPREMPARESDDPEDAGFARQWVERSLAGNPASTFIYRGQSLQAEASRLALPIVSESKRPDDTWAYGVEYELRTRLQKALGETGPAPLRVFCNAHGCLCYFEGITTTHPLGIAADILDEPWARDFGIEPLSQFVTNGGGTGPEEHWWQMMIVTRPQAAQPRK